MMPLRHPLLLIVLATLAGGLGAGCAADLRALSAAGQRAGDAGPSGELEAVGELTQVVPPRSDTLLTVRYSGAESQTVEFAVVAAEVEEAEGTDSDGDGSEAPSSRADAGVPTAPGASLSDAKQLTNEKGEASTLLMVGTTPGKLRVRARVAGLPPVFFNIEVSPDALVKVDVSIAYEGLRPVSSWSAAAIENVTSCEEALSPDNVSMAEGHSTKIPSEALRFELRAGRAYAIVAWGRDSTYAELASGCELVVPMKLGAGSHAVNVTIADKPMRLIGTSYPLEISLAVDASMARLAATTQNAVTSLLGSDGEAYGYLQAAHEVLEVTGQPARASELDTKLASTDTRNALVSSLSAVLASGNVGYFDIATAFSNLLSSVGKTLEVPRAGYGVGAPGVPMTLTLGKLVTRSQDGYNTYDLTSISSEMAPTASIQAVYDDTRAQVNVESLSIGLGLGTYGRALTDAFAKGDAQWYVSRFSGAAGCSAVATWFATEPEMKGEDTQPLCDSSCATKVCAEVMKQVVDAAREAYLGLDAEHAAITLTGALSVHNRNDDDAIEDLGPSTLGGNWGREAGAAQEDIVNGSVKSPAVDQGVLAL